MQFKWDSTDEFVVEWVMWFGVLVDVTVCGICTIFQAPPTQVEASPTLNLAAGEAYLALQETKDLRAKVAALTPHCIMKGCPGPPKYMRVKSGLVHHKGLCEKCYKGLIKMGFAAPIIEGTSKVDGYYMETTATNPNQP